MLFQAFISLSLKILETLCLALSALSIKVTSFPFTNPQLPLQDLLSTCSLTYGALPFYP